MIKIEKENNTQNQSLPLSKLTEFRIQKVIERTTEVA